MTGKTVNVLVNIRMPVTTRDRIDTLAWERGTTRSELVRRAVDVLIRAEHAIKRDLHVGGTRNPNDLEVLIAPPL